MSVDWFVVIMVGLVLALALYLARPSRKRLRRRGERFAAENLAYVDSEFVDRFDKVNALMDRLSAAASAGVFLPAFLVADHYFERDGLGTGILLASMAVVFGCIATGRLWLAGREFPVPAGRPALARSRHVGITDFIPPESVALCVLCGGLNVVVGIVALRAAVDGVGEDRAAGIAMAVAAVLIASLAVLAPVYLWLVCRRPESAVDGAHLYFQDAWRSSLLAQSVGIVLISTSQLVIQMPSLPTAPEWTWDAALWVMLSLTGAIIGLYFRSKLWFRKRLWSELAPGQVLLPGQPIGAAA